MTRRSKVKPHVIIELGPRGRLVAVFCNTDTQVDVLDHRKLTVGNGHACYLHGLKHQSEHMHQCYPSANK